MMCEGGSAESKGIDVPRERESFLIDSSPNNSYQRDNNESVAMYVYDGKEEFFSGDGQVVAVEVAQEEVVSDELGYDNCTDKSLGNEEENGAIEHLEERPVNGSYHEYEFNGYEKTDSLLKNSEMVGVAEIDDMSSSVCDGQSSFMSESGDCPEQSHGDDSCMDGSYLGDVDNGFGDESLQEAPPVFAQGRGRKGHRRRPGRIPNAQRSADAQPRIRKEDDTPQFLSYELTQGYRILQDLMSDYNKGSNRPFMNPVELTRKEYRDYAQVVENPIWLRRIKEKFHQKEYTTVTEYVADVRTMLENCYRFFGPEHPTTKKGLRLEQMLEQKLALLPKDIRSQCTLEATSGQPIEEEDSPFASRRRFARMSVGDSFSSHLLWRVRNERSQREKEQRKKHMEVRKAEKEEKEKEILEWEEKMLAGKTMESMWELPQIGHFVCLTMSVLNISEVPQFELERIFLMPQASKTLAMLMTSLLSSPNVRLKLDRLPPMPYRIWTRKLCTRVDHWYRQYYRYNKDPVKVFEANGIEPHFWKMLGEWNPLQDYAYHELTYHQRIWLVKSLCDYLLHHHKTVQDSIADQSLAEQRECLLGYDRDGNSFIHFPQFCGQDLRIYRQALSEPVPLDVLPLKEPRKRKRKWKASETETSEDEEEEEEEEDNDETDEKDERSESEDEEISEPENNDSSSHNILKREESPSFVRTTRSRWKAEVAAMCSSSKTKRNSGRFKQLSKPETENQNRAGSRRSARVSHLKESEDKKEQPVVREIGVRSRTRKEINKRGTEAVSRMSVENDGSRGEGNGVSNECVDVETSESCVAEEATVKKEEQELDDVNAHESLECDAEKTKVESKPNINSTENSNNNVDNAENALDATESIRTTNDKDDCVKEICDESKCCVDRTAKEECETDDVSDVEKCLQSLVNRVVENVTKVECSSKEECDLSRNSKRPLHDAAAYLPNALSFSLVVEDVKGLRALVQKFMERKQLRKRGARKPPEEHLLDSLVGLLKELEPWEMKLIAAARRSRFRLYKEWEDYNHRDPFKPDPAEEVWKSEQESEGESEMDGTNGTKQELEKSEESSEESSQDDEEGSGFRRKRHSRRAKRKRKLVVDWDEGSDDSSECWELSAWSKRKLKRLMKGTEKTNSVTSTETLIPARRPTGKVTINKNINLLREYSAQNNAVNASKTLQWEQYRQKLLKSPQKVPREGSSADSTPSTSGVVSKIHHLVQRKGSGPKANQSLPSSSTDSKVSLLEGALRKKGTLVSPFAWSPKEQSSEAVTSTAGASSRYVIQMNKFGRAQAVMSGKGQSTKGRTSQNEIPMKNVSSVASGTVAAEVSKQPQQTYYILKNNSNGLPVLMPQSCKLSSAGDSGEQTKLLKIMTASAIASGSHLNPSISSSCSPLKNSPSNPVYKNNPGNLLHINNPANPVLSRLTTTTDSNLGSGNSLTPLSAEQRASLTPQQLTQQLLKCQQVAAAARRKGGTVAVKQKVAASTAAVVSRPPPGVEEIAELRAVPAEPGSPQTTSLVMQKFSIPNVSNPSPLPKLSERSAETVTVSAAPSVISAVPPVSSMAALTTSKSLEQALHTALKQVQAAEQTSAEQPVVLLPGADAKGNKIFVKVVGQQAAQILQSLGGTKALVADQQPVSTTAAVQSIVIQGTAKQMPSSSISHEVQTVDSTSRSVVSSSEVSVSQVKQIEHDTVSNAAEPMKIVHQLGTNQDSSFVHQSLAVSPMESQPSTSQGTLCSVESVAITQQQKHISQLEMNQHLAISPTRRPTVLMQAHTPPKLAQQQQQQQQQLLVIQQGQQTPSPKRQQMTLVVQPVQQHPSPKKPQINLVLQQTPPRAVLQQPAAASLQQAVVSQVQHLQMVSPKLPQQQSVFIQKSISPQQHTMSQHQQAFSAKVANQQIPQQQCVAVATSEHQVLSEVQKTVVGVQHQQIGSPKIVQHQQVVATSLTPKLPQQHLLTTKLVPQAVHQQQCVVLQQPSVTASTPQALTTIQTPPVGVPVQQSVSFTIQTPQGPKVVAIPLEVLQQAQMQGQKHIIIQHIPESVPQQVNALPSSHAVRFTNVQRAITPSVGVSTPQLIHFNRTPPMLTSISPRKSSPLSYQPLQSSLQTSASASLVSRRLILGSGSSVSPQINKTVATSTMQTVVPQLVPTLPPPTPAPVGQTELTGKLVLVKTPQGTCYAIVLANGQLQLLTAEQLANLRVASSQPQPVAADHLGHTAVSSSTEVIADQSRKLAFSSGTTGVQP